MTLDPATVAAIFTGVAGVIASVGALVKIIVGRPRMPVAEELLEQLDELRDDVLALAKWAHRAQAQAALAGLSLEDPPEVLRSAGHRAGERRHDDAGHGWRSSVRVQTGELPALIDHPPRVAGPDTQPERRRQRPTPPPVRE